MADQRYKSPAQLEHERRQELLRILRQVSAKAAERWPRVQAADDEAAPKNNCPCGQYLPIDARQGLFDRV